MSRPKRLLSTIFLTLLGVASLSAASPTPAHAQTGRLSGTVTDSTRTALGGTQVSVLGTRFNDVSDASGHFRIVGVPAGTYDVRVQRIGQRAQTINGVVISAGQETQINVALASVPLSLGGVVVSASRRAEKITDAPATITRIDAASIQNTVGNSFAPALKEVKGIDYIQVGVTAVAVNARGFNSAFNNRMLMMEDNRISVLPENGLPVGAFTTTPKVDLAGIEVLVGPGSALYGPDASNGVLTLSTKDPREYPGTTLEAAGGVRSFFDVQGRHAGVVGGGKLGYKVTGEYQQAKDFSNKNIYAPIVTGGPPSPELNADWNTDVMRGSGSLVYYMPNLSRFELTGGASKSNGIGQTSVGRNQLVDWQYRNAQLKFTHPNWFAQAYMTQSLSGDTYQLNGFAQNRLRFPTISEDSVKHLSDFPAEGRLMAAEVQNTFVVPQLNRLRLTYGAQYRHDIVSSKRQWLVDRNTGKDVETDQKGVYGQADLPLVPALRAVFAARYDKHELFDGQFSPKAALLFTPVEDQTFRVTFNRAFKSPTVLQYGFFFPDFAPLVGVFGNPNGYIIKNGAGAVVRTIDPIEPETNNTWELGYKGVIANRLYVDVTGYRSNFKKFMSPLVIIANPLTPASAGGPTFAYDAKTGAVLKSATANPAQIPLTYFNVGNAQITGTDIGLKLLLTPNVALNGTASLQQLDTVERQATDPLEATAFNSPTTKFNVGMDFANLYNSQLRAGFTARYVNGYRFLSGINNGKVPTFSTFDVTAGYKLPAIGASINLSVQNLFACRGGTSTINGWLAAARPLIYTPKQECGFGKKHIEMINMPEIGTMAFLGIRLDR
ncbi:MAG TPA: TonB-dependent receptor [Gemmatimonadaceae bacterium]|nr:TonB-dependent receptor [Gemmatimonadaceae bacterium]